MGVACLVATLILLRLLLRHPSQSVIFRTFLSSGDVCEVEAGARAPAYNAANLDFLLVSPLLGPHRREIILATAPCLFLNRKAG